MENIGQVVDAVTTARCVDYTPGKVLVVDDEPAILRVTQMILTRNGFNTYGARSGHEAYELVKSQNGGFDFYVLDMQMPGMSGLDLLDALAEEGLDGSPAIISSGMNDRGQELEPLVRQGKILCIWKPFNISGLYAKIDELYAMREAVKQGAWNPPENLRDTLVPKFWYKN